MRKTIKTVKQTKMPRKVGRPKSERTLLKEENARMRAAFRKISNTLARLS